MSSVDNRIVEMQFNNQQFERNIQTSTKSLESLKKSLDLKDSAKSFAELEAISKNFSMARLASSVESIAGRFTALGIMGVTALQRISNAAIDAGMAMLKSFTTEPISAGFSKYEEKIKSVQTIMNSTGKSVSEVNAYLDELMWFSDETSYGFNDMTAALAQMTSSGGDIDTLIPMITGVANATAYAGKGATEFSRAMFNLNQSYGMGSLQGGDWRSLELAGVGSKELKQTIIDTGVAMGKLKAGAVNIGNFQDSLQGKGKLKGWANREVMEASFAKFAELSQAAYDAVAAGEYETAGEAIQALSGNYSELSQKAFKSAQSAKTFSEAIFATKDAVSSGWMKTSELIFGNITQSTALWSSVTDHLWDLFASGAEKRNKFLEEALGSELDPEGKVVSGASKLQIIFKNLFDTVSMLGGTMKGAFSDVFGKADPKKLKAAIYGVITAISGFNLWLQSINGENTRLEQIGNIFKGIFSVFKSGWTILKAVGKAFADVFKPLIPGAVDGLLTFFSDIGESITEFADNLGTNKDFVAFFEGLGKVLADIAAALPGLWATISTFFTGLWTNFKNSKFVTDLISNFNKLKEALPGVWESIKGFFTNTFGTDANGKSFWDRLKEKFIIPEWAKTLFRGVGAFLSNVLATISDAVLSLFGIGTGDKQSFWDRLKERFAIPEWVSNLFVVIGDFLKDLGVKIKNAVFSLLGIGAEEDGGGKKSFWDKIKEKFAIPQGVKDFFAPVIAFITKLRDDIKESVTSLFGPKEKTIGKTFWENLKEKFATPQGVKDFINGTVALVKKTWESIKSKILGIFAKKDPEKGPDAKKVSIFDGIFKFLVSFGKFLSGNWGWLAAAIGAFATFKLLFSIAKTMRIFGEIGKILARAKVGRMPKKDFGNSMLKIAGAIAIIVAAIGALTLMDQGKMKTAVLIIGGIALVMFALTALGNVPKLGRSDKVGTGMLAMAGSIFIIVLAIKKMMDLLEFVGANGKWGQFIGAIAIIGLFMVAMVALGKIPGGGGINGNWKSIIAIAAGVWILVKALKPLANMEWHQLGKMAAGLGVLTLAIGALIWVSNLGGAGGTTKIAGIIGLAIGMWLLIEALMPLANMDWEQLEKMGAVMGALTLAIGGIMAASSVMTPTGIAGALVTMAGLAGLIWVMGETLTKIKDVDPEKITAFTQGLSLLVGVTGLSSMVNSASLLGGFSTLISSIGLSAAIATLAYAFTIIPESVDETKIKAFTEGVALMIGVSGGTTGLLSLFGPAALFGAFASLVSDAGLSLTIATLAYALTQIPESVDETKITAFTEGVALMIGVSGGATGLLSLFGPVALFGAFASLVSDAGLSLTIATLGDALAKIPESVDAAKITAFTEGVALMIGVSGGTTGLLSLFGPFALFGSFASFVSNAGLSLTISTLADALAKVKEVDAAKITAFTDAVATLVGANGLQAVNAAFPLLEGIGGYLENLGLSEVIGSLGGALSAVATSGVTEAQIIAFTASVESIFTFAKSLKERGFAQALQETIFGTSVSQFAGDIGLFSTGLSELTAAMSSIKFPILFWVQSKIAIAVCNTIVAFFDGLKASKIEDSLNAENPAAAFVSYDLKTDMENFATAVSAIATSLQKAVGLDMGTLTTDAIGAVSKIKTFLDDMQKEENYVEFDDRTAWQKFWGAETKEKKLANAITNFGTALAPIVTAFQGIVVGEFASKAKEATDGLKQLVAFLEYMGGDAVTTLASSTYWGSSLNTLITEMPRLGNAIFNFNTNVAGVNRTNFVGIVGAITDFVKSFNSLTTEITPDAIAAIETSITNLSGLLATNLTDQVAAGIQNGAELVVAQVDALCTRAVVAVNAAQSRFVTAGYNLSAGFAIGIKNGAYLAINAASDMAGKAIRAARLRLDMNSPSREFEDIGMGVDEGFAGGIIKYGKLVDSASGGVAKNALNSAKGALRNLSSVMATDVDTTPTIRPVMDLSNVTRGAGAINGLLNTNRAFNVAGITSSALARRAIPETSLSGVSGGVNTADTMSYLGAKLDALGQAVTSMKVVMNNGVLVGQLKTEMDRQLGREAQYKGRG